MLKTLSLQFIWCICLERDIMTLLNCKLASKPSNDKSAHLYRQNKTVSLEKVSGFVCLFVVSEFMYLCVLFPDDKY